MKPRLPDSPIPCAARPIAAQVPNQGVETRKIWASTVTMKSARLTAAVASALRKLLASPPQDPAAQAGEAINAPAAMMLASAAAISVATVAITPGLRNTEPIIEPAVAAAKNSPTMARDNRVLAMEIARAILPRSHMDQSSGMLVAPWTMLADAFSAACLLEQPAPHLEYERGRSLPRR